MSDLFFRRFALGSSVVVGIVVGASMGLVREAKAQETYWKCAASQTCCPGAFEFCSVFCGPAGCVCRTEPDD